MNVRSFVKTRGRKKPARKAGRSRAEARDDHREQILRAAEALFSRQGFHGTGLREIAEKAKVSLGNIYNHFETKEHVFEALLVELEEEYLDPAQPLPRALMECEFPEGLEKIGLASRETVKRFAAYIRLIYVDVIEFDGHHVARLYGGMKERYAKVFASRIKKARAESKLNEHVDPLIAAMMASILYMYYFTVEHLFGVKRHYGLDDEAVVREFAKVLRQGITRR
jgi:AcrR family transcriptional regulator